MWTLFHHCDYATVMSSLHTPLQSEVSSALCSLNNSDFSLLTDQLRDQLVLVQLTHWIGFLDECSPSRENQICLLSTIPPFLPPTHLHTHPGVQPCRPTARTEWAPLPWPGVDFAPAWKLISLLLFYLLHHGLGAVLLWGIWRGLWRASRHSEPCYTGKLIPARSAETRCPSRTLTTVQLWVGGFTIQYHRRQTNFILRFFIREWRNKLRTGMN